MLPDTHQTDPAPLLPPPGTGVDRWEVPTRLEACQVLCGSSAVRLPEVRQIPGSGERPTSLQEEPPGATKPGWAPLVAPPSGSSELSAVVPLPALLKEQWRPLDMLGKCLHGGAILTRQDDGRYVLQAQGTCLASARDLEALVCQLAGRRPQIRVGLRVRVNRPLLDGVHTVINQGETLTAFVLEALRHEIVRRRADDARRDGP